MRRSRLTGVTASLLVGGLLLAACGEDGDDDTAAQDGEATEEEAPADDESPMEEEDGEAAPEIQLISEADTATCDPTANAAPIPDPEGTGEDVTEINFANFSGWDENYVVYNLVKVALEEQGYTVNATELEAGAAYQGVAGGDADALLDAWLPNTHGSSYVDMDAEEGAQLGDSLQDLGCWFDQGFLTIAVNSDSPAESLANLADFQDEYGGRIVGIEPGAGLTRTTREQVIPTYGLEDWDFSTSSSPAMLAELESAIDAGENIVVTLWHPHWAYAAFDIRDLEDPEGSLGEAERLYALGRPGFDEDYPNVAQLLQNLHLTDQQLLEIEDLLVVQYNREQNERAVTEWLEDNPEFMEDWRAGEL